MKQYVHICIIVLLLAVPGKFCFAQYTVTAFDSIGTSNGAVNESFPLHDSTSTDRSAAINKGEVKFKLAVDRLKQHAAMLKKYATENNYSTDYCFLVDMSVPSGKKRFFVYNFKKDSFEVASMVSHGVASSKWDKADQFEFSNEPWSLKTSAGKYKIGASYNGHYGLAFKLYGLDSTNNKAFERAIVLHAYKNMPDGEVYPKPCLESIGCPAVSTSFLSELNNKYIKASRKPILMWIYN